SPSLLTRRPAQQFRLAQELCQVNLSSELRFQQLQTSLQLPRLGLQSQDLGRRIVARPDTRHLGIAELPLQSREEVERVTPLVGAGDLPFFLPEERRHRWDIGRI